MSLPLEPSRKKISDFDQQHYHDLVNQLLEKTKTIYLSLSELITETTDIERLETLSLYLEWIDIKTRKVKAESIFNYADLPDLTRGDVILTNLGFNLGDEFGGEHAAIVLKNSPKINTRVLVLPITSKEPVNKHKPFYVKIGKIHGMNQNKFHWANIYNIRSISKLRIIYPPEPKKVNGTVLNRISGAIMGQIALRKTKKINHQLQD